MKHSIIKKMVGLGIVLGIVPLSLLAQDVSELDIRKQIRNIKLSENYVYAEAASMESAEAARATAVDKLQANAVNLLANRDMGKQEIQSTLQAATEQQQLLEYSSNNLFKAFACVPKAALMSDFVPNTPDEPQPTVKADAPVAQADETPQQPAVSVEPVETPQPVAQEENPAPDAPVGTVDSAEDNVEGRSFPVPQVDSTHVAQAPIPVEPVAADMPSADEFSVDESTAQMALKMLNLSDAPIHKNDNASEATPATQETASTVVAPTTPEAVPSVTTETATAEPTAPSTETETVAEEAGELVDDPFETLPEKHVKVLKDILSLDKYESVMLYLVAMKEDGRVMYGPLKKIFMPERAYLIIINHGQLETILNRGTDQRVNLKTSRLVPTRNYVGKGIIWLQIF